MASHAGTVSERHRIAWATGVVLALVGAAIVAGLASRAGAGSGAQAGADGPGAVASSGGSAATASTANVGRSAALGVFRGTDPGAVATYERWLGRDVDLVVDFSTRATWADIAAPRHLLKTWRGTPYRQVQSVALLPEADDSATIAAGAAGAYDDHYRELATRLVAAGQSDAILRLGWEFNLPDSRWATDDSEAFITYWRRVVAAMRSVPEQHFEFDWNPNNGSSAHDAVAYYPGDDVVDYVGIDAYDVAYTPRTYPYPVDCPVDCRLDRQKRAWSSAVYGGPRGLQFWAAFAARHGKPMSLPEWGLWRRDDGHGGAENLYYLNKMADFIRDPANHVAYHAYFEFDGPDGEHQLMVDYPTAGVLYRRLFGSSS